MRPPKFAFHVEESDASLNNGHYFWESVLCSKITTRRIHQWHELTHKTS